MNLWIIKFLCIIISTTHWHRKKVKNSIVYFENFPFENAGYQYRSEKWCLIFKQSGFQVSIYTLFNDKVVFDEKFESKYTSVVHFLILWKRFYQIISSMKFESVVVRRELLFQNDYGNLFFEKLLLKIHPNAILDFDDDLSAAKNQPKKITNWYGKLMQENGDKFNESLKLYKHFIVASDHLKQRVLEQNKNFSESYICVIPTCVDYDKYPSKKYSIDIDKINFGWIGGAHNYFLLDQLIPLLEKLSSTFQFKLLVIGDGKYERKTSFSIENRIWNLKTEVKDLMDIDIGLMPLDSSERSKGKGGFKLIQYMGLGIVSVASRITINEQIVDDGVNSFLAESTEDWEKILVKILQKKIDLKEMGAKARKKIERNFTFKANELNYLDFIRKTARE